MLTKKNNVEQNKKRTENRTSYLPYAMLTNLLYFGSTQLITCKTSTVI